MKPCQPAPEVRRVCFFVAFSPARLHFAVGVMKVPRRRVRVLAGIVVVVMVVLLVLPMMVQRQYRIVFSNGSWLTVRRVTFGTNHMYYNQAFRRTIATLVPEKAWAGFAAQFPRFVSRCGISELNACVHGFSPSLAVFGEFKLRHPENRFWEFTTVDGEGRESSPMATPMLDEYHWSRGPCVLAWGQNPPTNWPIVLYIYERNPTNAQRVLLAKLPARRVKE